MAAQNGGFSQLSSITLADTVSQAQCFKRSEVYLSVLCSKLYHCLFGVGSTPLIQLVQGSILCYHEISHVVHGSVNGNCP